MSRDEATGAAVVGAGAGAVRLGQAATTKTPLQRDVHAWLNDRTLSRDKGMGAVRASAKTTQRSPLADLFAHKATPNTRPLYRGAVDSGHRPGDVVHHDMASFSRHEATGRSFARARAPKEQRVVHVLHPGAPSLSFARHGLYDAKTDTLGTHRRRAEHLVHGSSKVSHVEEIRGMKYVHLVPIAKASPARFLLRNKHNLVGPGLGVAGAGGVATERHRTARRNATAAAAGAAGYGGFVRYGTGLRAKAKAVENTPPEGMSNSKRKKVRDDHLKSHGLHPNQPDIRHQLEHRPEVYRTWPPALRDAPYRRKLGQLSGKRGKAIAAASIAAPAAAVLAPGRRVQKAQTVYGYQERRLSPVRATETAVGVGLGAWGLSRMHSLNSLAAYGMRVAERNGAGNEAERALEAARKLAEATRRQTGRGERALRANEHFNAAVEAVPAALRPAVATTAGALLVNAAHPVHTQRFRRA